MFTVLYGYSRHLGLAHRLEMFKPVLRSQSRSKVAAPSLAPPIKNRTKLVIYISSVSDPYSLNPDPDPVPAKNLNPDPDPGKFFSPAKKFA